MNKKFLALFVVMLLLAGSVSASHTFQLEQVFYPIYSNGELVPTDDLPTLSYQDRTYVPLRKLSEATGLSVEFDTTTDTIQIRNTALDCAIVYATIIDTLHEFERLHTLFGNTYNSINGILDGLQLNDSDGTQYFIDSSDNYLNEFVPSQIEKLRTDVALLSSFESILGKDVIDTMNVWLYHADTALTYAKNCNDVIKGYAHGIYTFDYSCNFLYGTSSNGMMSLFNDHSFKVAENYYIYVDEFYNKLFDLY